MTLARNSPEIRKKSGIRNGRAKATTACSQPSWPAASLDAERRVHHHHDDDAEALGVVDPVDPSGRGL